MDQNNSATGQEAVSEEIGESTGSAKSADTGQQRTHEPAGEHLHYAATALALTPEADGAAIPRAAARPRGRGSRAGGRRGDRAAAPAGELASPVEPALCFAPTAFVFTAGAAEAPRLRAGAGVRADAPSAETARMRGRRTKVVHKARAHEEGAPQRVPQQAAAGQRDHREILVNVDARETRIALIENGKLVELRLERVEKVVGNVYKGRVMNVLPGMAAAFVDIGLERNAFLYVGDILHEDFRDAEPDEETVRRTSRDADIRSLVKPGQEVLVQIIKGPRGTKGARVSTRISLPGRYLVLVPESETTGVSRKVASAAERDRLRKIVEAIRPPGYGLICRTEGEGHSDEELREDLDLLLSACERIAEKSKAERAPAVIHKDLGPVLKTIRDIFGQDVDRLVIDSREGYEDILSNLEHTAPELVERVFLHEEKAPLFQRYNLEEEIDRLLRRKVTLPGGSYLLIDTTEALTTIDVNTGKFVGTSSLSETILNTNLAAVEEIARQLRLRDIGGMIVLDFIDMNSSRDRQTVQNALELAFRRDRTRTKISHISPLGLVEMTRKRTSESVTDMMSHTCPYCTGRGKVWSPETVAIRIEREILKLCAEKDVDAVLVYANPEVVVWLVGAEGDAVERLERTIRRPVYVRARHEMHQERYEIHAAEMQEMERELMALRGGDVVECMVVPHSLIASPRSAAWVDGYLVDLGNAARFQGQTLRARLSEVRRSFALGEPVGRHPGQVVEAGQSGAR